MPKTNVEWLVYFWNSEVGDSVDLEKLSMRLGYQTRNFGITEDACHILLTNCDKSGYAVVAQAFWKAYKTPKVPGAGG